MVVSTSQSRSAVLTDLQVADGVLRTVVKAGEVAGASVTSVAIARGPLAGHAAVAVWVEPPDLVSATAAVLRSSVAARRRWKASQVAAGDVPGSCRVALVATTAPRGDRGLGISADVVVTLFGADRSTEGSAT